MKSSLLRSSEFVFSVGLALAGIVLLVAAFQIKQPEAGTRIMPIAYSTIILVGSLIGVIRAILSNRARDEELPEGATERHDRGESVASVPSTPTAGPTFRRPLTSVSTPTWVAVSVIGYLILLNFIGYVLATSVFGVVLLRILGKKITLKALLFPVLLSISLYVIFEYGLSVNLP